MKQAYLLSGIRMMARRIIPIAVLFLGILFPLGSEGMAAPVTLTIVHTGSVNGHLFACPT